MVSYGSTTTFTVTPSAGYSAVMSGTCGGSLVGTTYTTGAITAACSETATFSANPYTLTVTKAGTGTGNVTPDSGTLTWNGNTGTASYPYGTQVILTPVSDVTSSFTGWTGCDNPSGTQCTESITAAKSVTANFAIKTFQINASASGGGSISPSGTVTVNYDGSQTFFFAKNSGYHIVDVLVDGSSVGADQSWYTFNNVTANHSISVSFANTWTITASAGTGGSINPSGAVQVTNGSSQTFNIAPNNGYYTLDVQVDSVSIGAVASYPFTNVTGNHTISATFAPNPTIMASVDGVGGSISPSGTVTVNYNGSQTFTITPQDVNYTILDVVVDGASKGPVSSWTFNNVTTSTHTIVASFSAVIP
jgi:hypothetical protein